MQHSAARFSPRTLLIHLVVSLIGVSLIIVYIFFINVRTLWFGDRIADIVCSPFVNQLGHIQLDPGS
jgi:predicted branched-subunit amino acid permease